MYLIDQKYYFRVVQDDKKSEINNFIVEALWIHYQIMSYKDWWNTFDIYIFFKEVHPLVSLTPEPIITINILWENPSSLFFL